VEEGKKKKKRSRFLPGSLQGKKREEDCFSCRAEKNSGEKRRGGKGGKRRESGGFPATCLSAGERDGGEPCLSSQEGKKRQPDGTWKERKDLLSCEKKRDLINKGPEWGEKREEKEVCGFFLSGEGKKGGGGGEEIFHACGREE